MPLLLFVKAYTTYKLGGKMSELLYSPATYGVDFSSKSMLKPRARQSPMMAVCKNTLWLMGGIVEVRTGCCTVYMAFQGLNVASRSAETSVDNIFLDDIWSLGLNSLDGFYTTAKSTTLL